MKEHEKKMTAIEGWGEHNYHYDEYATIAEEKDATGSRENLGEDEETMSSALQEELVYIFRAQDFFKEQAEATPSSTLIDPAFQRIQKKKSRRTNDFVTTNEQANARTLPNLIDLAFQQILKNKPPSEGNNLVTTNEQSEATPSSTLIYPFIDPASQQIPKKKSSGIKNLPTTNPHRLCSTCVGLEEELRVCAIQHDIAREHFHFRQEWYVDFLRTILMSLATLLSWVIALPFLSTAQKILLNFGIGLTATLATFLHTMGVFCSYGDRAVLHDRALHQLEELREDLARLRENQEDFLGDDDNDKDDNKKDDEGEEILTFESFRLRFRYGAVKCKSSVPMQVVDAFDGLRSTLLTTTTNRYETRQKMEWNDEGEDNSKVDETRSEPSKGMSKEDIRIHNNKMIYFEACQILARQIRQYRAFPGHLPNGDRMLTATMKRLGQKYGPLIEEQDSVTGITGP